MGSFGLCYFCPSPSCPNHGLIRTPVLLPKPFLSQSWAHSDSFSSNKAFPVSIMTSFGLCYFCPRPSCPNYGLIRTPVPLPKPFLSESYAHSDSVTSVQDLPVRIMGSFGLPFLYQSLSCLNHTLIRTLLLLSKTFLSESWAHSDSGSSTKAIPV